MNQIVKYSLIGGTVLVAAWFIFMNNDTVTPTRTPVRTVPGASADIKIVAFGDSLTAGYGVDASESYPSQLENLLLQEGYSVQVLNLGVSGETTRGNFERASFVRRQNPDIVLVGIGGNDALRSLSVADAKSNIENTIKTLQSGTDAPQVVLLQMQAPLSSGFQYKAEFDSMYEDIADTYDIPLVPFLTTDLFLAAGNRLSDGIHYSAKGYTAVIEKHILPALRPLLSK